MVTHFQFRNFDIDVPDQVINEKPEIERFFESGKKHFGGHGDLRSRLTLALGADDRLCLLWRKEGSKKPIIYELDFNKQLKQLRSFPAPKQGAFNQALGNKSKAVLDVTGGWGGDAMLMATQGYKVTLLERNPLMALLLSDAYSALKVFADQVQSPLIVPSVSLMNSISALTDFAAQTDCVYVDPMFPPKKKKSAATNKQMQLLQWLIGEDDDASQLVEKALVHGAKRVSVKRPDYAQSLYREPDQQFSSKLVHYDVYLAN